MVLPSVNHDKVPHVEVIKKSISAVIPALNSEKYLVRAVESLLETRYPDLEIVIVDDGSADATLQIANALRSRHPDIVRVYQHKGGTNAGVSASRNLGIIRSTGEWIAFLDADDYVYPNRFEAAARILDSQPDVDAVYGFSEMFFECQSEASTWSSINGAVFGLRNISSHEALLKKLIRSNTWHTSAITCRRSLLAQTGLFAEKYTIAEDCHLWLRMATIGNIVEDGSLEPISVYCRHEGSLYELSIERKADYVRVLLDYRRWAIRNCTDPSKLSLIDRAITQYILRALIVAREAGDRRLARKLVRITLLSWPSACFTKKMVAQIRSILVGR